jgi:multicomponent Na+:H+ antiporter subunit C
MMQGVLPYVACILLAGVGLYAVTVKKNLIKVIIGVVIIHNAVNLFLVLLGYRAPATGEAVAPIVTHALSGEVLVDRSVDPVPQALILTAIVIGLSVVALMVVMAIRLHEKYGTFDLTEIRKLRG